MAIMEVTNVDLGELSLGDNSYEDDLLAFAAAGDVLAGTLLGRVTASGKLVPYASAAADGSEVPVAVLPYAVSAAAAGDVAVRVLISGRVNLDRLVIHADGDASNITKAVRDDLRNVSIVALKQTQHSVLDNQ